MLRTNSTLNGLQLQLLHNVNRANRTLARNELAISTGKRIHSASDDPSGFIFASRRRAELASVQQSLKGAEKANALLNTADASLSQITEHLNTIRSKALEAAGGGLSQSEIVENQAAIDEALRAIDSVAKSTVFAGKQLLDGSQGSSISGMNSSQVSRLTVLKNDAQQSTQTIEVDVTTAAAPATLTYEGKGGSRVKNDTTFTLTGHVGSVSVTVEKNDSLSSLRDTINQQTNLTGVTAEVIGDDLTLTGTKHGSAAQISVAVSSGKFDVTGGNGDGRRRGRPRTRCQQCPNQ